MENIEEIFNEILVYDVQEALKYSSDGFKKSGNPEYLIYTAHGYLVQGFYEDAIAAVDLAFELGCDYFVYGYNVKGEALLNLGLYVESRRCFERVTKEEPEQYLANTFLIELDIRESLYEDAINKCVDYMENFECDNKQLSDLKCIIGWTYLVNLNNPEIAKEAFIESIEANENCGRSYTGLGVYEANYKRFEEAIEYFNKAIEINEDDGENYFGIAICNKELNNFDVVEEYLVKANALEPEDNRIIEEYAFELLRQERNKDAIEYFKEVLRENPNNIEIKNLILELEKIDEI
ncbi:MULTISPECIES: lipopolysaccharide assembly protein LapB [unclassified Clostridium]|uniref:tetratricopeptide repeat protein n=1 Tax=unclassified Clostridium TaxID=2614128 RepID=UPI001C8C21FB|nr:MULTISPECIES: tetratricopeptide repeat protein [unclassified Clostridium]MBX9137421.1 tetratricopeptide repeat protein [Clostridium sp. K12(2020)]MBX9144255.1 tetratricopeptide repeat protein [Clostridium sp. K13]